MRVLPSRLRFGRPIYWLLYESCISSTWNCTKDFSLGERYNIYFTMELFDRRGARTPIFSSNYSYLIRSQMRLCGHKAFEQNRTADLLLTMQTFYLLNYKGIWALLESNQLRNRHTYTTQRFYRPPCGTRPVFAQGRIRTDRPS